MHNTHCKAVSIVSIQRIFLWLLVAAYSIGLLLIEWQTSQLYVRQFVTDIQGDVFFYAINTTVSVFLLWATALLFGLCLFCFREQERIILSKSDPPPNPSPEGGGNTMGEIKGISISNILSKIQQRQDYFFIYHKSLFLFILALMNVSYSMKP
ncbi:membrane protein [Beggiatoa sp. PS]|nr:membrane protein [Beggiatoa sp. PS]